MVPAQAQKARSPQEDPMQLTRLNANVSLNNENDYNVARENALAAYEAIRSNKNIPEQYRTPEASMEIMKKMNPEWAKWAESTKAMGGNEGSLLDDVVNASVSVDKRENVDGDYSFREKYQTPSSRALHNVLKGEKRLKPGEMSFGEKMAVGASGFMSNADLGLVGKGIGWLQGKLNHINPLYQAGRAADWIGEKITGKKNAVTGALPDWMNPNRTINDFTDKLNQYGKDSYVADNWQSQDKKVLDARNSRDRWHTAGSVVGYIPGEIADTAAITAAGAATFGVGGAALAGVKAASLAGKAAKAGKAISAGKKMSTMWNAGKTAAQASWKTARATRAAQIAAKKSAQAGMTTGQKAMSWAGDKAKAAFGTKGRALMTTGVTGMTLYGAHQGTQEAMAPESQNKYYDADMQYYDDEQYDQGYDQQQPNGQPGQSY